jgi:hypothetical protein
MAGQLDHQIKSLIEAGEGGNVVSVCKQVLSLLREHGVSYEARLSPNLVGVHPENRDGVGVLPSQVHKLLSDIVDLGFCEDVITAVCAESTPAQQKFNVDLMQGSHGSLPSFACDEMVKYCSLGASHTNQCLRLVLGQVAHADDRLTINGKLNLEKVLLQDAGFARALTDGLKWTVLPHQVLAKHEKLASLIQCGLNASGQIIRAESELQVLRRIHACWLAETARCPNTRVEFSTVQAKIGRSKPPCSAYLHLMFNFLLRRCGGKAAELLVLTDRFVGLQMIEPKVLGGEVFDVLASDVRGVVNQYNLVRHALFKVACVHGLQSKDAKRVLIDKQAQSLEDIIAQLTQMCSTVSSPSFDVVNMVGQFEMAAIASILGKRSESIHLLAHDFIVELNKHTGQSFPSRFEAICCDELKAREAELTKRPRPTVKAVEQCS